jgi:hypothetical protein
VKIQKSSSFTVHELGIPGLLAGSERRSVRRHVDAPPSPFPAATLRLQLRFGIIPIPSVLYSEMRTCHAYDLPQVPSIMKSFMAGHEVDRSKEYKWSRLPAPIPLHIVDTYYGAETVLSKPQSFEPVGEGFVALSDTKFDRTPV